jgi:hypothetical protein
MLAISQLIIRSADVMGNWMSIISLLWRLPLLDLQYRSGIRKLWEIL